MHIRDDTQIHYIDALKIAHEAGSPKSTNLVMLGAFVEKTKALDPKAVVNAMRYKFKKAPEKVLEANIRAFTMGSQNVVENRWRKTKNM